MRQREIITVVVCGLLAGLSHADVNRDYRAGVDAAHQARGVDVLKSARPADLVPGFTAAPVQSGYYDGVTGMSDQRLKNDGTTIWSQSPAGQAVSASVQRNPGEKIAQDAPFITASRDVEDRADALVGNLHQSCSAQNIARSQFTRYTCERDLKVEQFCARTATVTGQYEDTTEIKSVVIDSASIAFSVQGARYTGAAISPLSGVVMSAQATYGWRKDLAYSNPNWFIQVLTPFGPIAMDEAGGEVALEAGASLHTDQPLAFALRTRNNQPAIPGVWYSPNMHYWFTVMLKVRVSGKKWVPTVAWSESCPFSKAEGALTGSVCTAPGGDRTAVVDGTPYTVHQACWGWRDTYITQTEAPGTCEAYLGNPACQLAASRCAFTSETGVCLHQNATYSCETRTTGQQMICGGEIYCLDGDCDKTRRGTNDDFAPVVSQLAALAAAGRDVAALSGQSVKAFTGQAKYCKKFAVGFSNCCKDSGWGQDVGLAQCSSEEKALGKARIHRLTVSVGEFCAKKVLGVCLEKKRSYCQFDSKLAQIVQEQGRAWQLGIGFGGADSPDCRGLSVPELQHINFRKLDFSSFTDDLMKNQTIPDNAALLDMVKGQIQQHLNAIKPEGQ